MLLNELQKDATEKTQLVEKMKIELQAAKEQLIQHRKEFDRLSKDIKKSDKLAERIAKLTKDLNTEQRRSNKTSREF